MVTELSDQLTVLSWNGITGEAKLLQTIDLVPANFTGTKSSSEIAASADGRFVYAGNRGDDTVEVFSARHSNLTEIQHFPAQGQSP